VHRFELLGGSPGATNPHHSATPSRPSTYSNT